jgi:FkbM family methyltransferase
MKLSTPIKFAIQRFLRSNGWEIRRFRLGEMEQLSKSLTLHGVTTVLDVGANIGQFGQSLRQSGYAGRIISFEPQSDAHLKLFALAKLDSKWTVAPRCALGETAGELDINISDNSVSSSLLPILGDHVSNAPASRYVRTEKVPVIRLDDCELVPANETIFIKIDTQGFEEHVLNGAPKLLARAAGLQLEMSIAQLYEGQADWLQLLHRAKKLGFVVWHLETGFLDRETGQVLQADATLFRSTNKTS